MSSSITKDDGEKVVFEINEFIGDSCTAPTVAGRIVIDSYTCGDKDQYVQKSVNGCIHISDGNRGYITFDLFHETRDEAEKEEQIIRDIAKYLEQFANAIAGNSDFLPKNYDELAAIRKANK